MVFALVVFAGVAAGIIACLLTRRAFAGWFLVVAAAVWEPANNNHLEGPILWTQSPGHGLTVADLYGLAGFAVATLTLVKTSSRGSDDWTVAGRRTVACVLIFLAGVTAAYLTG